MTQSGGDFVHNEKAARDFSFVLFLLSSSFPIGDRCMADAFMKETAERPETLKTNFETDVSDSQVVCDEKFLSPLDAPLDQVLMCGLVECLPEESEEMIARETGLFGNLLEIQRVVVAVVDKLTCSPQPFERFQI